MNSSIKLKITPVREAKGCERIQGLPFLLLNSSLGSITLTHQPIDTMLKFTEMDSNVTWTFVMFVHKIV